jgi:hypothetical protein
VLLFSYLKRLHALQFCEEVKTFAVSRKTLPRPNPSLREIIGGRLEQSRQTLAGDPRALPLLIMGLFISSADELIPAK